MHTYRFVLTGLGNVGRNVLEILLTHNTLLRERYGFDLQLVGAADSGGTAYAEKGLPLAEIVALKRQRRSVVELPGEGKRGSDPIQLMRDADADLLLEATPTNLRDAQPGLDIVRAALRRSIPAVLASKGPLVLAYAELAALSDLSDPARPALRFSSAVGGALPTINVGRRDLAGSVITRVEAIVNGTSQVILGLMEQGQSFDAALAEAQKIGIVEPDPALDVDGWDAANKLVIIANAVLNQPTTLHDVQRTGIRDVTLDDLRAARAAGGRLSLVGVAERQADGRYQLSVAPTALPAEHPLARLGLDEMGVVYYSDIYGRTTVASAEQGPVGTAAAMLRDVIDVVGRR